MAQKIPHADEGTICPLHKVDTSMVCHRCPWWTKITGKNPQSEEMIDDWRCAIALLPMLLIEGAQQTRQAGAAVESMRNNIVSGILDASSTLRRLTIREINNGSDSAHPAIQRPK